MTAISEVTIGRRNAFQICIITVEVGKGLGLELGIEERVIVGIFILVDARAGHDV